MKQLIEFLTKIEKQEIAAGTAYSQDFTEILKWSSDKNLSKDNIRKFLLANDRYSSEEDLEFFMRDLFTEYLILTTDEDRNRLTTLLSSRLLTGKGKIDVGAMRSLIAVGFKCYPVSYTNKSFVLGITTNAGHITLAPAV